MKMKNTHFVPPPPFFLGSFQVPSLGPVVLAGMVCVVHGLCGSGEGGQKGHYHRGIREVGEWGRGRGCRVPGVFIRYIQKEKIK
jgi:hypothetical protein